MNNPYCIQKVGQDENRKAIYGMVYKDKTIQNTVGFPESWGTKRTATIYMANTLGLTYRDYVEAHKARKI